MTANYSHCIHNWPVTREIGNSFKFNSVLGLRAIGMMHYGPFLKLLGFYPHLGQFNRVQWK